MMKELKSDIAVSEYAQRRLDEILDVVELVARGDYSATCDFRGNNDYFDALGMGINMMIDEIRNGIKEIEKERDYTNSIISSMSDFLIVVSYNATIQKVNQATLRILGYKEDELVDKPISVIFRKEESELSGVDFKDLFSRGDMKNE